MRELYQTVIERRRPCRRRMKARLTQHLPVAVSSIGACVLGARFWSEIDAWARHHYSDYLSRRDCRSAGAYNAGQLAKLNVGALLKRRARVARGIRLASNRNSRPANSLASRFNSLLLAR